MAQKLKEFLTTLARDPDTLANFRENPKAVMDEHGLEKAHQELLLEGDVEKLREATGADESEVKMWIV